LDLLGHLPVRELRLGPIAGGHDGSPIRSCADRLQAGTYAGLEQRFVPDPVHQRVTPVEEDRLEHAVRLMRSMARRLLWASLALAPLTLLLNVVAHPGKS